MENETKKQAVTAIDHEICEKFLRWFSTDAGRRDAKTFDAMAVNFRTRPEAIFRQGIKTMTRDLKTPQEDPLARIILNPMGILESGMILGYAMACASQSEDFKKDLTSLFNLNERGPNVTDISSARKA